MYKASPIALRLKSEKCDFYPVFRRESAGPFMALALTIVLGLLPAVGFSLDIQRIEHPPLTSMTWVGERIEHNGMPLQILQLNSELSTKELFTFYRELWQPMHAANEQATMERFAGEWQIISTLMDGYNVVVQVKPSGAGLEGFMSATPLDKEPTQSDVARNFPRQWGTELVSSTQSTDGGTKATTLVLKNTHTLQSTHDFYSRTLQENGWTLSHQNTEMGGSVMFFDSSDGAVELAIRRDKSNTVIFANVRGEGV